MMATLAAEYKVMRGHALLAVFGSTALLLRLGWAGGPRVEAAAVILPVAGLLLGWWLVTRSQLPTLVAAAGFNSDRLQVRGALHDAGAAILLGGTALGGGLDLQSAALVVAPTLLAYALVSAPAVMLGASAVWLPTAWWLMSYTAYSQRAIEVLSGALAPWLLIQVSAPVGWPELAGRLWIQAATALLLIVAARLLLFLDRR